MANNKDMVTKEVLEKATQDILQTVSEHLYDYEPYTDEQIAEIFDLDNVTAKSLSKVINDEYVAKNKVFSNEHTMELLSKTLAEANQYTTEQIANSGKLERKIVTSTSEVIDENILYLILTDSTNNIYTQYMLIDGNATPLGTTQINLSDYLKTIDFNTKIDEYAKKNTVVLQNDVVGDLTTLSSNQVLSTQGVSDELDKKVDKSSIVTSIDSTSTDSEVPSAKAIYNEFSDKMKDFYVYMKSNTSLSKYGVDDITNLTSLLSLTSKLNPLSNSRYTIQIHMANKQTFYNCGIIPVAESGLLVITTGNYRGKAIFTTDSGSIYVSTTSSSETDTWSKWQRLCATSVADVKPVRIDLTGNSNIPKGYITYMVKNGICYVSIISAKFGSRTPVENAIPEGTFPKPAMQTMQYQALNGVEDCTKNILVSVNSRGGLSYHYNSDINISYDGSFSYPVA